MSTQHTPGPWTMTGHVRLVGDPDSENGQHNLFVGEVRHPDRVGPICYVQSADHCPPTGVTREEAEANARLIAAATELLEVAKLLALATNEGDDAAQGTHYMRDGRIYCKGSFLDTIERARAAIAKATGIAQLPCIVETDAQPAALTSGAAP